MTDNIYIRGIDPAVKVKLEKMARQKNLSLNKYIINILTDYTINPTLASQDEKYSNLVKDVTALYQNILESTNEKMAETNHLLRDIKEYLEER